jgi:AraC-like DNA-binding protein
MGIYGMLNKIKNIRKISNIPGSCIEKYLDLKGKKANPLKEFGVYYSGISYLKKGYQIGLPDHKDSFIIIFTKSGTGYLLTSQGEIIMDGGTVTVIPAWEPCLWAVYRDEWTILWFHCRNVDCRLLKGQALHKPTAVIPRLENAMAGYLQETAVHPAEPGAETAAELYSRIIASYLRGSLQGSDLVNSNQLELEKLRDEIKGSLSKNWSTKLMAKKLNISASTLQRRCFDNYRKTPRQILIEMRMEYAETLAECTDYPLKTIALSTGYSDEFIFSSAFKKYFGISPKFYRKKQKNETQTFH